ncbi:MAG: formate hydrogenlyase maturation HycH family protein [Campylobacteraceae bacterium]
MIQIYRLTKREADTSYKNEMPDKFEQIKIFYKNIGHGAGKIDFVEKVYELEEEEYLNLVSKSGEYAKFKLGNLSKYFEIEVFPEHVQKLKNEMPSSKLKEIFEDLKEGYFVIRKTD